MAVEWKLNDSDKQWLQTHSLDCFDTLMSADIGEVIDSSARGEVRKLTIDGRALFLKRIFVIRKTKSLEVLLQGFWPNSEAVNEYNQIQWLASDGFSVVHALCAAQFRKGLFPSQGFILTDKVDGIEFDDFARQYPERMDAVMEKFVVLVRQLHAAGFYSLLRPKDIFINPYDLNLVMIDRETRIARKEKYNKHKSDKAWVKIKHRSQLSGFKIDDKYLL